jgi:hypothetical protein
MTDYEVRVNWEGGERRFSPPQVEVRLGAAPDNDWVIPCPGVSRHHAVVRWEEGRLRLRDCESKNGLVVAGRRHSEVLLEAGQVVNLGRARLRWGPGDFEGGAEPDFGPARAAAEALSSTAEVLGSESPAQLRAVVELIRGLARERPVAPELLPGRLTQLAELVAAQTVVLIPLTGSGWGPPLAQVGSPPDQLELAALSRAAASRELRLVRNEMVWVIARHSDQRTALAARLPGNLAEDWRELAVVVAAELLGSR